MIYLIIFCTSPPSQLAPIWLVVEFVPRWLIFLPLILLNWFQLNRPTLIAIGVFTFSNLFFVNQLKVNIQHTNKLENSITVVTFNMGGQASQVKEVMAIFLEQEPDIMFLQESVSETIRKTLPNDVNLLCNAGLCVLSRHQIVEKEFLNRRVTGSWGTFGAKYSVTISECLFEVVNVHPDTPRFTLLALIKTPISGYKNAQQLFVKREIDYIRLDSWFVPQRQILLLATLIPPH